MSDEKPKGQVGQYYLMEKIAQGGMAEIFKGLSYDVHGLKKTVCIKKILPHLSASKEFIDSLIDEAKLAVKLVHGNIAQTYDLGKVGDDYFMVMEYVDGKSLSQIHKKCMTQGELIPIPYLVYFISEVLNGLSYMHRRTDEVGSPLNIVHRDISPQNIMVSYSGTIKIIDFGIAKAALKLGSTDSGMLKGKFAYMSPEQAYGDATDHRSDVFSLGIILHEMLTGKRLFKAEDSRETIRNVRRAKVVPPSALSADIPEELDRITLRALAKDRRHRYENAADMHNDLVKFLYTNCPEFKPSDLATFVHDLFKDEFSNRSPAEEDARTPHLIIDRSNSALADDSQFEATGVARAPLDLREYMLEEPTSPPTMDEAGQKDDSSSGKKNPLTISEPDTDEKTAHLWRRFFGRYSTILLVSLGVLIVLGLLVNNMKHDEAAKPQNTFAEIPTTADIIVTTTPTDAAVSLDGKFIGQGSPVTIQKISTEDEHILDVAKTGYTTNKRNIKLEPGEFKSINIALNQEVTPKATIELISNPAGATVFIDDKETSHRTPVTLKNFDVKREHTLGLYISGHRFWSKSIKLDQGETKSFDVSLAKDFGSLTVDSFPSNAIVVIDGAPVGQTPVTKDNLEPGKVYKIEIWSEGYENFSREIKGVAGRKEEIRAVLVPLPKVKTPDVAAPAPDPGKLIDKPAPIENNE